MLNKGLPDAISLHHYPFASSLSCVGVVIVIAKGVGLLVLLMIVVTGVVDDCRHGHLLLLRWFVVLVLVGEVIGVW